jgi:hypothetical protein
MDSPSFNFQAFLKLPTTFCRPAPISGNWSFFLFFLHIWTDIFCWLYPITLVVAFQPSPICPSIVDCFLDWLAY